MKHSVREPGLLRLLVGLPLLQIIFILFLRRSVETVMGIEVPQERWFWVTLAIPLLLLAYTLIPWWSNSVGRFYLPFFVVILSLYFILEKYLTLLWFIPPAQQALGLLLLTLRLWVSILLLTLIVAGQYSRGWVLWLSLAFCLTDGVLSLPFLQPRTPFYSLTLTLFFARLLLVTSVAVGVQGLVERQRRQRAALTAANLKLVQAAATTERLATNQERIRLARELHDSVVQSLYSIGMAAQTSLRLLSLGDPSLLEEPIEHIEQLSKLVLTEIHEQVYNLRPAALVEKGLVAVITQYCALLNQKHDLLITFETNLEENLSIEAEEHLYYIVREALWNVIKHARAGQVQVKLWVQEGQLCLAISDDGQGFEVDITNDGMGLKNMSERVKLLKGEFVVRSKSGQGSHILIYAPTPFQESKLS